jgi:beta-glucuronidase
MKNFLRSLLGMLLVILLTGINAIYAQQGLIANIASRKTTSLDGKWQYIVDPYERGFYDYRYKELRENDRGAYWNSYLPDNKTDRKEFGYNDKYTIKVPGDWNSQNPKFLYYEGTVWYKKSFDYVKSNPRNKLFLYFGAVNYSADVYLNGRKLGAHKGGFTPFDFEIPDTILKRKDNFLVVRVDNKRYKDEVPTLNTDWWNYGGITREVKLVELPAAFIQNYFIQLKKTSPGEGAAINETTVSGWVQLNGALPAGSTIKVDIPELHYSNDFAVQGSKNEISFNLPGLERWSPAHPKLYKVNISAGEDKLTDKIGFRTIAVSGRQVLLNGKPIFMRGICIHGEIPQQGRRAHGRADAAQLLGWARQLNCNMVRLAHYPHDESMTRMADSLGILIWSEIPVYWTIDFGNPAVLDKAKQQLTEMIARDQDRACVIIWSVGNETPVSAARTEFMRNLLSTARELDSSRLVSAALEVNYNSGKNLNIVDDPLGQYVDIVAFNEYLGWYGGLPANCRTANWAAKYDKPLFISETGAGAKSGFHADSLTRWSEEYQTWYYKEQVSMLQRMPDNFTGISPWILADFRSPKRNNPWYQEGWNRKGLIGQDGKKKKAFYLLKAYYDRMEKERGN